MLAIQIIEKTIYSLPFEVSEENPLAVVDQKGTVLCECPMMAVSVGIAEDLNTLLYHGSGIEEMEYVNVS